ncbi:MAG: nucleotidyltransferase domain-containing protein [Nanoarchaeota archaeon]|nr:nucleotidyltransferase domain-containing protein [Nanoarchaeota archaeon]
MGQLDILNLFFEYPSKNFHIRGISKELNIPKTTVGYHVNGLMKDKLIIKHKSGVFPSFRANEAEEIYRHVKKQESLKKIIKSKLLDVIEDECNPRCIVLFGSFAKGEYSINSDIDLFVQAKDTKIVTRKFEKKLKHKVNLFFESDIKRLSSELLNNIVNGIKLRGFLKIR